MTIVREIHVGDVGTIFEFTVLDGSTPVDISSASTLQIKLVKPSGPPTVAKTATLSTDGTDGKLRYVTVEGDLDEDGTWKAQPYVVLPSGARHGSESEFVVWAVN